MPDKENEIVMVGGPEDGKTFPRSRDPKALQRRGVRIPIVWNPEKQRREAHWADRN